MDTNRDEGFSGEAALEHGGLTPLSSQARCGGCLALFSVFGEQFLGTCVVAEKIRRSTREGNA
jgi:hypothetical protein